jgi:hypothetical protein
MGAVYRNTVRLAVEGSTSAGYSGSKAGNGETTDDSD